jgi:mannose/fructose/N-acetylgalactosamine-specific phosphotransferase system component IIB
VGIALFRVDERLIHGQVTVGWGNALGLERYVVVDDQLPNTDFERELFGLGVPSDASAEFVSVQEARELLPRWAASGESSVVLTRDLDHMVRLARGGALAGHSVNLGGIHHRAGRDRVLPYVFLDPDDRQRIRALEAEGVTVTAQDLPGARATPGRKLVDD